MGSNYIYVQRDGEIYGPATPKQLIASARQGIVLPTDELGLSREGPWYPASSCVELGFPASIYSAEEDQCLFIWEGATRIGPFSRKEIRKRERHNEVTLATHLSDGDGKMTTVGKLLNREESPLIPLGQLNLVPQPAIEFAEAPTESEEAASPPAAKTVTKQQQAAAPKKPRPPRNRNVSREHGWLEELVEMERETESIVLPRKKPGLPKTSRPGKQNRSGGQKKPVTPAPAVQRPEESQVSQPKLIRRNAFQSAYMILAMLLTVQSVAYLLGVGTLAGKYLIRIFFLTLEVFVPFESATEHLVDTDLVFAGFALVFIAAEICLPLFFLMKAGTDFRLWAIIVLMGLILSQLLEVNQLLGLGQGLRFITSVSGIAMAAFGARIVYLNANNSQVALGIAAVIVTVLSAIGLFLIDLDQLLQVQLKNLPPTLSGTAPTTILVGVCLLGQWLPLPLYCFSILLLQTDPSTRDYIKGTIIGVSIAGAIGLFSLGLLNGDQSTKYLSIPQALLPLAIGASICAVVQAILWLLQPAQSMRLAGK